MNGKPLAPLLLLAALLVSACEDPSNVGLSLIGESGGEPELVPLAIQSFEVREIDDFMGGGIVLSANLSNPTPRLLTGIVDDPLIGRTEAMGFIRFGAVGGISAEFREGPVTAVELLLRRDYVYGDTTSVVEFEVRDAPASLDELAPVDTVITPGPLATTASFLVSDREIVIPLPEDWIATQSEVLRSTNFTTEFRGFALQPVSGNAVVGFSNDFAALRVVSAGDTVHYLPRTSLTTTSVTPRTPDERIVQAGTGQGYLLRLPPEATELGPAGVNGVEVRIPVDTVAMASQLPAHFIRPTLPSLRMTVRTRNAEGEFQDAVPVTAALNNGRYHWQLRALPETVFQDMINGEPLELVISAPIAHFSVSPVVLTAPGTGDRSPVVIITLTSATI